VTHGHALFQKWTLDLILLAGSACCDHYFINDGLSPYGAWIETLVIMRSLTWRFMPTRTTAFASPFSPGPA
jgi:hypothetical protein